MTDPNTRYDPTSRTDRQGLTDQLMALFERSKFDEVFIEGTKERVFAREVPNTEGTIRVVVYSTIVGDTARSNGKDAIRVCALYRSRDGRERGIASAEKRVNRTGTLQTIEDRVISRMRDCWKAVKGIERCHCGAPKFVSKVRIDRRTGRKTGGNHVCADLCWKTERELDASNRTYSHRSGGRGYGRQNYRCW